VESGDGAGNSTCTLYAGVSGMSGCWMTGADDVGRSFGSSENLRPRMGSWKQIKKNRDALFTEQVTKPDDGVCTIFH
jgi:hypothetical protein